VNRLMAASLIRRDASLNPLTICSKICADPFGIFQVDLSSKQISHRQIPLSIDDNGGGCHGVKWHNGKLFATTGYDLSVRLKELDLRVSFDRGEELRTEISAKFRPEGVARELGAAGFAVRRWWTDGAGRFGLSLAEAV